MTALNDSQGTERTRREFCVRACQAVSLATFGSALQGCGGDSPTSPSGSASSLPILNSTFVNGTAVLTIDAASPLAPVGGLALVRSAGGEFLVTRTSATTLTAVTAVCTHESCTITGFEGQIFVCPCHGSRYRHERYGDQWSGTAFTASVLHPVRRQHVDDLPGMIGGAARASRYGR